MEIINLEYSMKSVMIRSERSYKLQLIEKIEPVIKNKMESHNV